MRIDARVLLALLIGGLGMSSAAQQPSSKWEAPAEAKAVKNPLEVTPEVLAEGLTFYKKNCLMCHGETGKGDGPASQFIKPKPEDISKPEEQEKWTDGEIFWKITEGRNPMPPFGKKLSPEERWMLVHYVRSLKGK